MTYRPNTFAQLTDSRFHGIERLDLRARYGALLDGTTHPLSLIGLSAAQALYPNIGLSAATNLTTVEQDTAAWLQAEYDLRTGPGGIIGLPDGGRMMLSAQLWLQNAAKVWFHGGRDTWLMTAGCGTAAAVKISHADQGRNAIPLRDLYLMAKTTPVYVSTSGGGGAHTGFQTGAQALAIDNCQGAVFERLGWNGYESPIAWGDNTFGITFREWSATGCNIGLNWSQTAGLNSMERMRFENGASANCNYGVLWDATYATSSQGGSVFLTDNSFDYNIVRQIVYKGMTAGNSSCGNSFHVTGNHIETTGACSGTSLCRLYSQGALFASHNEFYEGDGNVPPGLIEVADTTMASANCNRINNNSVPVFFSSSSNLKRVDGCGNICQDSHVAPVLLSDSRGLLHQRSPSDGQAKNLFGDPGPIDFSYVYNSLICSFSGTLTFPSDQQANFAIGTSFQIVLSGGGPVTLKVPAGVTLNASPGPRLTTDGALCQITKYASNYWLARGSLSP